MTPSEFIIETFMHLAKQGAQSADAMGMCLYRGPGELKCAAGFWIADEDYSTDLEGSPITHPGMKACLTLDGKEHFNLLRALQTFHDAGGNWESPDTFIREARQAAEMLFAAIGDFGAYLPSLFDDTVRENWKGPRNA